MDSTIERSGLPFAPQAHGGPAPSGCGVRTAAGEAALRHVRIPWQADDRLILLYGHSVVSRLGVAAAADWALSGEPVVYLDGDHSFDPFLVGRLTKARRVQLRKVLPLIHVARAFTGHQMERLLANCLASALDRYHARRAVVSGLFRLLTDDESSERERLRLGERTLEAIRQLALNDYTIVCPCPPIQAGGATVRRLYEGLRMCARRIIRVHPQDEGVILNEEQGELLWAEPAVAVVR